MNNKEFYTVGDVAKMTGLKENSVRRALIREQLKGVKFGHAWMITAADFEAWNKIRRSRNWSNKHDE